MSLIDEIQAATDPNQFESKRASHPDASGERGDWCRRDAADQQRDMELARFKEKLTWLCKQRLEKGEERGLTIEYYRYCIKCFDYYLDVIDWYPEFQGAVGQKLIHEYNQRQQTERALVFKHFVDDAYQRLYGRPGLAKGSTVQAITSAMLEPMAMPPGFA